MRRKRRLDGGAAGDLDAPRMQVERPRAAAVLRVAQDRRAEAGAVDAQLVRPPGARLELELGGAPVATAQ